MSVFSGVHTPPPPRNKNCIHMCIRTLLPYTQNIAWARTRVADWRKKKKRHYVVLVNFRREYIYIFLYFWKYINFLGCIRSRPRRRQGTKYANKHTSKMRMCFFTFFRPPLYSMLKTHVLVSRPIFSHRFFNKFINLYIILYAHTRTAGGHKGGARKKTKTV